jgi:hypothetical protein
MEIMIRVLKKVHLRRVPHALSINQKNERVSYSKLPLTARMEQKARGFQRMSIGDEVWFLFHYSRDSVWAASPDELPQRIKQKIDMEKCLVSNLWSLNGIHSFLNVPQGAIQCSSLMLLCPV